MAQLKNGTTVGGHVVLHKGNHAEVAAGDDINPGAVTAGSTSKASDTVIKALSDDTHKSGFEAYSGSQGTGYVFVGQSDAYGGGLRYNGDDNPNVAGPTDRVTLFRKTAGADSEVLSFSHSSSKVVFAEVPFVSDLAVVLSGDPQLSTSTEKTAWNAKADKAYTDTELGKKADKTYTDTELGKKADKTYTDTELGKKADTHSHPYLGSTANAVSATKLATARTIALSGDVTGSATFNGSANATITATVANNSHTHTGVNVTQDSTHRFATDTEKNAWNAKADKTYTDTELGKKADTHSHPYLGSTANAVSATKLATARTIALSGDVTGSATFNGSANATITATVANNSHTHTGVNVTQDSTHRFATDTEKNAWNAKADKTYTDTELGKKADTHSHPYLGSTANAVSATKLATPRTVALSGDVTGSATFDGTANATITATVANNSHTHTGVNVTQDSTHRFATDTEKTAWNSKADQSYVEEQIGAIDLGMTGAVPDSVAKRSVNGDLYANDFYAGNAIKPSDTKIRVQSGDSYKAGFEAFGNGQGTGYVYVGRDLNYGGGLRYNGDDTPNVEGPSDAVTFYRKSGGAESLVLSYQHNDSKVTFASTPYVSNVALVRSDDARLTDARTPKTHTHDYLGLTGNAASATKLATARAIALSGDVTGSASFNGTANATITATVANNSHTHIGANVTQDSTHRFTTDPEKTAWNAKADAHSHPYLGSTANATSATKLVTARNIKLVGDVTGTASFNGTADASITAVVGNNTHTHTGSTISGLDGADITTGTISDARLPSTITPTTINMGQAGVINFDADAGRVSKITGKAGGLDIHSDSTVAFKETDSNVIAVTIDVNEKKITAAGGFVGNATSATKLATSRTIALSGDVTGSATFDGTANATITATVANNSHTHSGANVTQDSTHRFATDVEKTAWNDKIGLIDLNGRLTSKVNTQDVCEDSIGSTIPVRSSSSDITMRFPRSTYPNSAAIHDDAAVVMRNDTSDNYHRSITKDGFKTWLGLTDATVYSQTHTEGLSAGADEVDLPFPIDAALKNYSIHLDGIYQQKSTITPIDADGKTVIAGYCTKLRLGGALNEAMTIEVTAAIVEATPDVSAVTATMETFGDVVTHDIVGTVSQVGGAPTGAIIERGSYSSGDYVRFADGTQICWASVAGYMTTITGNTWVNSQFSLPVEFSSDEYKVIASCQAPSSNQMIGLMGARSSTTQLTIYLAASTAIASQNVGYYAIGRWY